MTKDGLSAKMYNLDAHQLIDAYLKAESAAFDTMPQPLQAADPALYNKLMAAKAARQQVES